MADALLDKDDVVSPLQPVLRVPLSRPHGFVDLSLFRRSRRLVALCREERVREHMQAAELSHRVHHAAVVAVLEDVIDEEHGHILVLPPFHRGDPIYAEVV